MHFYRKKRNLKKSTKRLGFLVACLMENPLILTNSLNCLSYSQVYLNLGSLTSVSNPLANLRFRSIVSLVVSVFLDLLVYSSRHRNSVDIQSKVSSVVVTCLSIYDIGKSQYLLQLLQQGADGLLLVGAVQIHQLLGHFVGWPELQNDLAPEVLRVVVVEPSRYKIHLASIFIHSPKCHYTYSCFKRQ